MYMSSHSVNAMTELKSEERHSHTAIDLQYVHVQGEEQSGFGARQGQTKFIHFSIQQWKKTACGKNRARLPFREGLRRCLSKKAV